MTDWLNIIPCTSFKASYRCWYLSYNILFKRNLLYHGINVSRYIVMVITVIVINKENVQKCLCEVTIVHWLTCKWKLETCVCMWKYSFVYLLIKLLRSQLSYKAFEAGTTLIINVIKLFDSNTFIQRGIIFPQTFTYMYILIVIIFCRYADKWCSLFFMS